MSHVLLSILSNESFWLEILRVSEVCRVSHDEVQVGHEPGASREGEASRLDVSFGLMSHSKRPNGCQSVSLRHGGLTRAPQCYPPDLSQT